MATSIWETLTRLEFKGYVIRVWREDEVGVLGPDSQVEKTVRDVWYRMETEDWRIPHIAIPAVIKEVAKLERINDVEVLTADGLCGACYYPNWP